MATKEIISYIKKLTLDSEDTALKKRDVVLFVNEIRQENVEAVRSLEKILKRKLQLAIIRDSKSVFLKGKKESEVDFFIDADFNQPLKIADALHEYQERILLVSCREERQIANFAKVVSHLPYLNTPTSESLIRSSDKVLMREYLYNYDKDICPEFMVANNSTKATLKEIKDTIGFPLVIKPAGLASSLLVTLCFHEEDLEKSLNIIFKKISSIYKENQRKEEPKVLVEKFMEGDQYSIDVYITPDGRIIFCPLVLVKTGRTIGFDDFFGYIQMNPTLLNLNSQKEAQLVAAKSILALGLRSTTAHIELLKTEAGWKIIEVGARLGGFRPELYKLSYNFDHALNDLLVRLPKPPVIRKTVKNFSAIIKFYPRKEGTLIQLQGVLKIKELASYHSSKTNKKIGDKCIFAKNGGKCVLELMMSNKKRSGLLADIRRAEEAIEIVTE